MVVLEQLILLKNKIFKIAKIFILLITQILHTFFLGNNPILTIKILLRLQHMFLVTIQQLLQTKQGMPRILIIHMEDQLVYIQDHQRKLIKI